MAQVTSATQSLTFTQTQTLPEQKDDLVTQSLFVTPFMVTGPETERRAIDERAVAPVATPATPETATLRMIAELRKTAGKDRAVFCRLNANGILGKLFALAPKQTLELAALRLAALKDNLSSFSDYANMLNGRKTLATEMLVELEAALATAEGSPRAFFDLLNTYEKTFNKVSLETMLDARFMETPGAKQMNLLKVEGEGTFTSVTDNLQKQLHMQGTVNLIEAGLEAEEALTEEALISVQPAGLTAMSLLNTYIEIFPAVVKQLIVDWTGAALLNERNSLNRAQTIQAMAMPATPDELRELLAADEDLEHNISVEVSTLHIGRIYSELKDFNVATASVEELLAARKHCNVFNQLQQEFDGELAEAEVKEQQAELNAKQQEIKARMVQLFAASEAAKPADKRLFWLNAPTTEQVVAKLSTTELMESAETRLYKHTIAYIDALQNFTASGDHASLIGMQQSRFDVLRSQQEFLVSQIKAQTAGQETASQETASQERVVLGAGEFDADMALLDTIHGCRQATAKYRPMMSNSDNVMKLAGQVIWRDELTLNEIKANLAHNHALKQLNYSFKNEFQKMVGDCPETLSAITSGLGSLISLPGNVWSAAKGVVTGQQSLFAVMSKAGTSYRKAEAAFADNLRQVLEVAESNPVAFRRVCGDFAQLVPQLKKLVGLGNGDLCDMLDQVSWRLNAESAASCFAGDEAAILSSDLKAGDELADNLLRFQCVCDLASGMLQGATGLNVIKSVLSGPAGIAGALFNVGTMYLTRETINRMPATQVRMLDKLFRYGPVMGWVTTSPYDVMAEAARGVAKNNGAFSAVVNAFMSPITRRYNALTEAFQNVWNHKPGAWAALAFETGKCAAIIAAGVGVTVVGVAAVSASGPLGLAGAAFTAAEIAYFAASASYGIARGFTYIEDNGLLGHITQSIAMFKGQMFSEKNSTTKKIRLRCELEAANLVVAMKKQDAYTQQTVSLTAQRLFRNHWDKVSQQQSHIDEVNSYLVESKATRIEEAEELLKQVRILELVAENIDQARTIAKDADKMTALRTELKKQGVEFMVPAAGLKHFLLDLKMAALSRLERQCGTTTPGNTLDKVQAYLTNYQREVMLGCVVLETLTEKAPSEENPSEDNPSEDNMAIIADVTAKAEAAFCRTTSTEMANVEQKRIEMMRMDALEDYIAERVAEGENITASDLQRKDMDQVLLPRIEKDMEQMRTVHDQWMANYKTQLNNLPMVKGMSQQSQDRILKAAAAAA